MNIIRLGESFPSTNSLQVKLQVILKYSGRHLSKFRFISLSLFSAGLGQSHQISTVFQECVWELNSSLGGKFATLGIRSVQIEKVYC